MSTELKNKISRLASIAILVISASSIHAQEPHANMVHISVSRSSSPAGDEQKIVDAMNSMLELRLNTLKGVQIVSGEATCDDVIWGPPRLQISASVSGHTSTAPSAIATVELVLEYDLLKVVREDDPQKSPPCKRLLLLHRSEPISLKTAFAAIVRMSNLLNDGVEEETAPPKVVVAVVAFTGSVSTRVKAEINNAVLSERAGQEGFEVRTFSDTPSGHVDYVVTGKVNAGGASFRVTNQKSGKPYDLTVSGSVSESDTAGLSKFFESSATTISNKIHEDRNPVTVNASDATTAVNQALTCKRETPNSDCISQSALLLPELLRRKNSNQASPQA